MSDFLKQQKLAFSKIKHHDLIDGSLASILLAEKQGCLFHGTPKTEDIKSLTPMPTRLDDRKVVFAGKAWFAISFMVIWTDRQAELGTVNDDPYFDIKVDKVQRLFQKGGYLYQLPPISFEHTDKLNTSEFISPIEVVPMKRVFIEDPLLMMKLLGVNVTLPNSKIHNW